MAKPPIPVGDARVAVHGTWGPANWVNVFYLTADAAGHTPGEVIAEIVQAFHDFFHDGWGLGSFANSWSTQYITVTYRDAADSTVRLRVADAQLGTAGSVGMQDAQVAYLVNWATGDPRRGGKPRTYICGVDDDKMQDTARLDPAYVTARNTSLLTWLTGLPSRAIPLQLVEMSFRDNGAWRTEAHSYPILGVGLNPVVATQRRRVDRLRPS